MRKVLKLAVIDWWRGSGGGTPPVDNWILATGFWDDSGVWEDDDIWID